MVNMKSDRHGGSTGEPSPRTPDEGREEQPLSSLLRELRDEASTWIRQETRLAKAELSSKINHATKNLGLMIAGALTAYTGVVVLLIALSAGLAMLFELTGMSIYTSYFAAFGLVGILATAIGIVIVKKAKDAFSSEELAPERTMQTLQKTKEWAGEKLK